MRYSIQNSTEHNVENAGGVDIKVAPALKIVFAELTDDQAAQLKAQGAKLHKVAPVTVGERLGVPEEIAAEPFYTPAFALEISRFDAIRLSYDPPLVGKGMVVALVDTGIRETHHQIDGHIVYSENFTASPMRDGFDHGTAVAGLLIEVAPECSILNLKVMGDDGSGTTEMVILAIERCIELWESRSPLAPKLINLSLGTADTGDPNEPLRVACRAALELGMYVNAAAGNGGPNSGTIMSPACEKHVFATGSADIVPMNTNEWGFRVSEFSSRGPTPEGIIKPDAIFFGVDLECASSQSDTATIAKSGTSFAVPFTSGMAILYSEVGARQLPNWEELAKDFFPYIPEEERPTTAIPFTLDVLIDDYLKYICINPQGLGAPKSNDYGEGLPFGDKIAKMVTGVTGVGGILGQLLPVMILIPMIGMMAKSFGGKNVPA